MSSFRHCEPVTDVTGVVYALRVQSVFPESHMFSDIVPGKRIPTPVCALARNDGVG